VGEAEPLVLSLSGVYVYMKVCVFMLHDVWAVGCGDENIEVEHDFQEVGEIRPSTVCLQSSERWKETCD